MAEKELRDKVKDFVVTIRADIIYGDSNSLQSFENRINGIMALIKEACWLKGGRRLPQFAPESQHYREGYTQAQHDMLQAGWKSCKEWEGVK